MIISNKQGIYKFPHKLLNDLRKYQENLKTLLPSCPLKMKVLSIKAKKLLKKGN